MRRGLLAVGSALVVGLTGCTVVDESPGTAEPAPVTSASTQPAGELLELRNATRAEGMTYDETTDTVVVAISNPPRLALLADGEPVRYVGVPSAARHLSPGSPGSVLVPGEDEGVLTELDLSTLEPRWELSTGEHTHDAALGSDGLVISSNEFGQSVLVSRESEQLATVGGIDQPGGVAASGNLGAVLDVRGDMLHLYDMAAGRELSRVSSGSGPTHLVFMGPELLAVADTEGDAVLLFDVSDPSRPELVSRAEMSGGPYGLAYDARRETLWVASSGENRAVGYQLRDDEIEEVTSFATVSGPYSLAVDDDGGVWVGSEDGSAVQHVTDPLGR